MSGNFGIHSKMSGGALAWLVSRSKVYLLIFVGFLVLLAILLAADAIWRMFQ